MNLFTKSRSQEKRNAEAINPEVQEANETRIIIHRVKARAATASRQALKAAGNAMDARKTSQDRANGIIEVIRALYALYSAQRWVTDILACTSALVEDGSVVSEDLQEVRTIVTEVTNLLEEVRTNLRDINHIFDDLPEEQRARVLLAREASRRTLEKEQW